MRTLYCLALLAYSFVIVSAQTLPPCTQRPTFQLVPLARPEVCVEVAHEDMTGGALAYTGLAWAEGRLYAARPLAGEVYALEDNDGDGLVETAQRAISGLDTPNSLLYADGALYIAGGRTLYRWPLGGTLSIIAEDLGDGAGLWNGGLAWLEGRLYVGIGAPCDFCTFDREQRGLILSMDGDGSNRRIEAWGIRQATALTAYGGAIWFGASAPSAYRSSDTQHDALNRLERGADYGFPYCMGGVNSGLDAAFDCSSIRPADFPLFTHMTPIALQAYAGAAFPDLAGHLLVLNGGSPRAGNPVGYSLVAWDMAQSPPLMRYVVPADVQRGYQLDVGYGTMLFGDFSIDTINRLGEGFYPRQLYGLAVAPDGTIYLSVQGGRIMGLRPQ